MLGGQLEVLTSKLSAHIALQKRRLCQKPKTAAGDAAALESAYQLVAGNLMETDNRRNTVFTTMLLDFEAWIYELDEFKDKK